VPPPLCAEHCVPPPASSSAAGETETHNSHWGQLNSSIIPIFPTLRLHQYLPECNQLTSAELWLC
jgi:hypothetical protein